MGFHPKPHPLFASHTFASRMRSQEKRGKNFIFKTKNCRAKCAAIFMTLSFYLFDKVWVKPF
jgi:hypothetical protein